MKFKIESSQRYTGMYNLFVQETFFYVFKYWMHVESSYDLEKLKAQASVYAERVSPTVIWTEDL